jgi:hypothetical protein
MKALNALIGYFDLHSRHRDGVSRGLSGDGVSNLWILALYLATFLGVISKMFVLPTGDEAAFGTGPWFRRCLISLVITGLILPAVYKEVLDKAEWPQLMKCFVAFGAGFAYKALMDEAR